MMIDPERLDEGALARMVDEVLASHDPGQTRPQDFLGARFDAGLAWLDFPPGHGGLGASRRWQPFVERRFRDVGAPSPMRNFIGVGMAGPTIAAEGTEDQRRRYLRACFSGEELWCQLFSEPGAGSDLAALATRAERDGDEWVITGQKVWSSFAHIARRGMLLARTDVHVPKHRGLTYFLLDMRLPGVGVEPLRQMTGDAEFNEVWLDEVRVADADRVGEVGGGWSVALTTLMNERTTLGGGGGEARRRPIEAMLDASRTGPARDGAVRDRMVGAWIGSEVLRMTNARAAAKRRRGTPGPEGSIGKLAIAEHEQSVRDLHVDLLGASGTGYTSYQMTRPERFAPTPRSGPSCAPVPPPSRGARPRSCATSWASGCSACPRSPGPTATCPGPTCPDPDRRTETARDHQPRGASDVRPHPSSRRPGGAPMSFRFVVEEGKVAELAKAVRDDNPAHRDRAAAAQQGFAGIPAPLTFVAASAHWRTGPNPLAGHDLDLTRTLHGESEWEHTRPLLAGEELTVHQDLAGIEEKQGRRGGKLRIYTLENRYVDASGHTVVTERWRLIETAKTVEA